MEMHCANCCEVEKGSSYSNVQDSMKFNKTIIPFALVGYEIVHSQLGATPPVGYLIKSISYPTRAHGIIVK